MLMLWFAALLAATLSTGIPTTVTCETRVFGDATVGCIPGLDEDQLAVAYATVNPSFHPKGVWSLSITLQRHRSARRVHDFINILDSIARSRCHVTTAYYNAEFCADVNVARNVTNAAYDALFPDEDLGIVTPANTSVFIPEYVSFHEVRVNELWSQLHDGAGQPVFVDRVVLQKLSELIRAKVARLKQLADDDANMWTKLLVYSTAPSSSALACPVLEDAYAHAASMLPPGVTFNGPLSCSALPPLGIRRSVREVILTMYLDVGLVCSDTLAFPVPIIFNETHLLTLVVPDGAVLSCAGEPPERTASLCAEGLYPRGPPLPESCVHGP
ncbi:uncharacterized protein LOC127750796 [Frankliniella occidentalis]|uniref:Uncharacterized protein LOC127750796 n=1 Tax=Frankliniella occidentalis TaxID=133901 RepID=A0A9C6XSC7_FRAOC|nr:uncharacterized protein LOC127750796 [Frankliniella occidentalis]